MMLHEIQLKGIKYNSEMSEYLSNPAFGSSHLKKIITETPADFKAAWDHKTFSETKFTILGTAVHTAILEPDCFTERYAMQPEDWGNKAVSEKNGGGKGRWDEFKKSNHGKIIINYEDGQLIQRIQKAAEWNEELVKLLNEGRTEVSAYAQWGDFGIKARADLFIADEKNNIGHIWDVKTSSAVLTDDEIFNIIYGCGYHFQLAHHSFCFELNGFTMLPGGWIFISTASSAVHVRVVPCPEELYLWGSRDLTFALEKLQHCIENDEWPGYAPTAQITIPEWVRKKYE